MAPPTYHGHFGAGKFGLGFVIDILVKLEVAIMLFQRPGSVEWGRLVRGKDVHFRVNSKDVLHCKFISDNSNIEEMWTYIRQQQHLFISTSRVDILQAALSVTHSFSTAVAAAGLDDVFQGLSMRPVYDQDTRVYAFENDFLAVEQFRDKVKRTIQGLSVVPVMCDRICTSREICENNVVNATTEDFPGRAVVCSTDMAYCHPFTTPWCSRRMCTPECVVLASTHNEEKFFRNCKLSLLNGIHYTLAFYAYVVLLEQHVPVSGWSSERLSRWRTAQNEEDIRLLTQVRILLLLYETDQNTVLTIFPTEDVFGEIEKYATKALGRINMATEDTVGRILNLSDPAAVQKKSSAYFQPLETFLEKGQDVPFADPDSHARYMDALNRWKIKIRRTEVAWFEARVKA